MGFKTTLIIIISIIISILLGILIYAVYSFQKLNNNLAIQVDTRTAIIGLKDNLTLMLNAETGGRGFTITNDSTYLEPYYQAQKDFPANIELLRKMLSGNQQEQNLMDSLSSYSKRRMDFLKMAIDLKRDGKEDQIRLLSKAGTGKFLMDNVRLFNQQLQEMEEELFAASKRMTDKSIKTTKFVFLLSGILAVLIILFLATVVINELNRRSKQEIVLREYTRDLQEKNKEIEQFAFIASHDLQQPLRTITNFAGLLQEHVDQTGDKESAQYAGFITKGVRRMAELIKDLLEYSRAGKDLERTVIDCNRLVKETEDELNATINDSKAIINAGSLPVISAYDSLRSVFRNLLSNAIKYSAKGQQPVISISVTENSREYQFRVKDNGIGIESKYRERIFDIFQRLHSREEYPGTGIGLSICKKVVELHGGRIWVESVMGEGSSFIFTIAKMS